MWASGEEVFTEDQGDNKRWKHWRSGRPDVEMNAFDMIEADCAAVGWGGKLVADIDCDHHRPVLCVKGKLCDNIM